MFFLRRLLFAWLLDRFVRGRRDPRGPGHQGPVRPEFGLRYPPPFQGPYGRYPQQRRGYAGRRQVRVGGCCLPIPLAVLTTTAAVTTARLRRRS